MVRFGKLWIEMVRNGDDSYGLVEIWGSQRKASLHKSERWKLWRDNRLVNLHNLEAFAWVAWSEADLAAED
ncbi:hypothetical protein CEXT_131901 [Caerostris extrusa]|uniref:Uncharacterized protein n=1 Tax=Caerostris extrusa TaxID=172846 RepID=A0AAV4P3W2_CAEEX|nr:hypothetical protein CEXT_131901 [Caerostris extrusa]